METAKFSVVKTRRQFFYNRLLVWGITIPDGLPTSVSPTDPGPTILEFYNDGNAMVEWDDKTQRETRPDELYLTVQAILGFNKFLNTSKFITLT